ncbi:MAG: hypothetical protein K8R69_00625 [Deltaproteobacteria bacterium]|nr:hypothetical protein [Deltaproteobacteria bacterium]
MKTPPRILFSMLVFMGGSGLASANDGGFYAVQPFGAKFDKPGSSFTLTGQYAQEIKKILPPAYSVITGMQPELKKPYERNFRGLQMQDAAGNALILECNSAKLDSGADNKMVLKETPETTCVISLVEKKNMEGDSVKVQVKDALQKAQEANQAK